MTADFDHAFTVVIGVEGGLTTDTGGLTRYGIGQRSYPKLDIANLTIEQAKAIYLRDYWQAASCDSLPWPLSMYVFDSAVNQGVEIAVRMLQVVLGIQGDGLLGRDSMAAIAKLPLGETCARFMVERAMRYFTTRSFNVYGRGWLKRIFVVAQSSTK